MPRACIGRRPERRGSATSGRCRGPRCGNMARFPDHVGGAADGSRHPGCRLPAPLVRATGVPFRQMARSHGDELLSGWVPRRSGTRHLLRPTCSLPWSAVACSHRNPSRHDCRAQKRSNGRRRAGGPSYEYIPHVPRLRDRADGLRVLPRRERQTSTSASQPSSRFAACPWSPMRSGARPMTTRQKAWSGPSPSSNRPNTFPFESRQA